MQVAPRIVLIHATTVAFAPIHDAFARHWPEAELVNLLDDSLSPDRARTPDLTPALFERFEHLGRYALSVGAAGILVTCSAFGPAIERMARNMPIPVLKPNQAMFEAAVRPDADIAMVATFAPSLPTMEAEFAEHVAQSGIPARLTTILIEEAMTALRKGDADTHNRLIAERAPELARFDAVMLAHFSTARAEPALRAALDSPVISPPGAAVLRLRTLMGADR